jgi:hypothetical protein
MLLGITLFSAVASTKCIRKPRSQRPVVWVLNELDAAYFNSHDDSLYVPRFVRISQQQLLVRYYEIAITSNSLSYVVKGRILIHIVIIIAAIVVAISVGSVVFKELIKAVRHRIRITKVQVAI